MKKGPRCQAAGWTRSSQGGGQVEARAELISLSPSVRRTRRHWSSPRRRNSEKGGLGRQTKAGACRSEGFVASEHVPDGSREPARQVDLRDLRSALAPELLLLALVALAIGRVAQRVQGRLEQRPAQVGRAVLCERAAAVGVARLDDARAEAGVAAELRRRREARYVADLGGDRVAQDPADPGHGLQERHVAVVGS